MYCNCISIPIVFAPAEVRTCTILVKDDDFKLVPTEEVDAVPTTLGLIAVPLVSSLSCAFNGFVLISVFEEADIVVPSPFGCLVGTFSLAHFD